MRRKQLRLVKHSRSVRSPDVGQRSGALKVDPGFWLVAGGLASVGVGRHAVETDLVAPGDEEKAES